MACRLLACFVLLGAVVSAQRRVDPHQTYHRVVCAVPLVGTGTAADPRRPQYAPWPPSRSRTGIVAFSFQVSDDGKTALAEFVAFKRDALLPILNDKHLRVFEKGKANKADIQTEFKKYKKDFDPDKFGTVLP